MRSHQPAGAAVHAGRRHPRALASGSVHIYGVESVTRVAEENYDFNVVRSGPGFEARGHIAWNVRLFDGEISYGRADVACAAVDGNTAWISGPVTKLVIDGEPMIPGPSVPRWAILRVRDMGEGNDVADIGSTLMFPAGEVNMHMWCNTRHQGFLPDLPNTRGNITVKSD